jgi:lysosomal alpha-mannosidase
MLKSYFSNQSSLAMDYNLQWTTLSQYFEAQLASNTSFPTVEPSEDFVPYTFLDFWAFWSGYFVSRPVLKGAIRSQYAALQATERLFTLAKTLAPAGASYCARFTRC